MNQKQRSNDLFLLRSHAHIVLPTIFVLSALCPWNASGQTLVQTDSVQSGGLINTPLVGGDLNGVLQISHSSNDPLLTLTGGATRTALATVVGGAADELGRLRVEGGSILRHPVAADFSDPAPPIPGLTGVPLSGTIGNQTIATGSSVLGLNQGAVGEATVTGPGSQWDTRWILQVGRAGTGTLNVTNGGLKNSLFISEVGANTGATGNVLVSGENSEWNSGVEMRLGYRGTGNLRIEDGGFVRVGTVNAGSFADSEGDVTITGLGSRLTTGGLALNNFASSGEATFLIENSGTLNGGLDTIGSGLNSNGTFTVTGVGSTFNSTQLTVGNRGEAVLNVQSGGFVRNGRLQIGSGAEGKGEVNISGTGSKVEVYGLGIFTPGGLTIGSDIGGQGVVNVSAGGELSAASGPTTSHTLFNGSEINIGQAGTVNLDSELKSYGKLIVNGTMNADVDASGVDSVVSGNGTINGAVSVGNGATISPGNSVGQLTTGNLVFDTGGNFLLEMNDANGVAGGPLGWDLLALTGSLTISANAGDPFNILLTTLDANNDNGIAANFNPNQNFSWAFLTADMGINGFAMSAFSVNATQFLNDVQGGSFWVSQDGNSLVLNYSVIPEPTAFLMVSTGLLVLLPRRRRRSRHASDGPGISAAS